MPKKSKAKRDASRRPFFVSGIGVLCRKRQKCSPWSPTRLDEYRSEVAAFASQRLLGNKAFMKKLITTDPSTAEKLIGKIREMRENFKVRKDPAAKAQLEMVRKAEKLFMQGLAEAGGTIDSKGKIHFANDEEDETVIESSETVIEDAANVSVEAESVMDTEGVVRENKKKPRRWRGEVVA